MKLMKLMEKEETPEEKLQGAKNALEFWLDAITRQVKKEEYDRLSTSSKEFSKALGQVLVAKRRIALRRK